MEINESNLAVLSGHLQKTLSPDGATRKSGILFFCSLCKLANNLDHYSGKLPSEYWEQPELPSPASQLSWQRQHWSEQHICELIRTVYLGSWNGEEKMRRKKMVRGRGNILMGE